MNKRSKVEVEANPQAKVIPKRKVATRRPARTFVLEPCPFAPQTPGQNPSACF